MKKITALFLSAVLVFGLAGCSSNGGTDPAQTQAGSTAPQSTAATSEAANDPVTTSSEAAADNSASTSSEAASDNSTSSEAAADSSAPASSSSSEAAADNPAETVSENTVSTESTENSQGSKILVVYYSATNNTEAVAGYIAVETGGDLYELVPTEPYSSADLNWTDSNSRVSREHDDTSLRVGELENAVPENWDQYDTIFIGYPIWWGIAAWPVDGFVTANDFTGKTVIPFCTAASSGIGESGRLLEEAAGTGNWLEGERFRSGASEDTVREWVKGLGLQ